ncbi:hypothetical protein LIER_06125 [Lithospermum erythrorhizon]|uniref:F-box domain-containing protein n=1 Tax=Lithospermum erythrorhizon TaxID=34254 RepID=A0AAV3P3E2_LITER
MSSVPPKKADYSSAIMISSDLIWEVLVHLPTRSLMRFKCVSKLWYSIIRNPKFTTAHGSDGGGGSGRLLITDMLFNFCLRSSPSPLQPRFMHANLNNYSCPILMHLHLTIRQQHCCHVTRVVKGLIGLYDFDINVLKLCNIATHELIKLPGSPSPQYFKKKCKTVTLVGSSDPSPQDLGIRCMYGYFLGFDPVKEVYKVLCLSRWRNHTYGELNMHVFCLGVHNSDNEWRTITPPPANLVWFYQQCLCINGALYFLREKGWNQQTLAIFHLNTETFEKIAIPGSTNGEYDLVEICASPALVHIDSTTEYAQVVHVWTMNRHCLGGWSSKRVLLPSGFNYPAASFRYSGTLPTGEMMLAPNKDTSLNVFRKRILNHFPFPIYVYDHHKNEMKTIIIQGYGSQDIHMDSPENRMDFYEIHICYYQENIISLDCFMKTISSN